MKQHLPRKCKKTGGVYLGFSTALEKKTAKAVFFVISSV